MYISLMKIIFIKICTFYASFSVGLYNNVIFYSANCMACEGFCCCAILEPVTQCI